MENIRVNQSVRGTDNRIDTQSQLKNGDVQQAVTTVNKGVAITDGARSLDNKLRTLQQAAKSDLKEYQQLDKDVTAQLKVTDGNYDTAVLKRCQKIDWSKKPYLKSLKRNVNKLLKQAENQENSTTNSSSTPKVSEADKQEAVEMRETIVKSDPGNWSGSELAKAPDSVIVAATEKVNQMGGDPGTTAGIIAKQYLSIRINSTSKDTDSSSTDIGDKDYLTADAAKQQLGVLDFYQKNQSRIEIIGQEKDNDAWKFTWRFKGGSTGGTFTV